MNAHLLTLLILAGLIVVFSIFALFPMFFVPVIVLSCTYSFIYDIVKNGV